VPVSKYDITLDLEKHGNTSHAFVVSMIGANKRVLDVGCDTGYLGEQLAAFGNVCWGFEINAASAEVARTRYERVEVGDLETVDLSATFDHHKFDVIVFADVLEHLRDPLPLLRQARAMVAPGGSVIISVPNVAHGDIRLNLLRGNFRYTEVGLLDDTHTRFFTRESLVDFVRDAGFTLVELRRTRLGLFRTEVGVRREDFDPAVVADLENDLEATTYQFVVRVVPDDVLQVSSEQAMLVDSLRAELEEQRRLVAELRAREKALSARVDELAGRAGPGAPGRIAPAGPKRRTRPGGAARRLVRRARRVWGRLR
jgi:O-antigen biosynthesis protein